MDIRTSGLAFSTNNWDPKVGPPNNERISATTKELVRGGGRSQCLAQQLTESGAGIPSGNQI